MFPATKTTVDLIHDHHLESNVKSIIFDLGLVTHTDFTGAEALKHYIEDIAKNSDLQLLAVNVHKGTRQVQLGCLLSCLSLTLIDAGFRAQWAAGVH